MLLLASLSLAAAPPPIINGETTEDYPEVVALYMTDSSGQQGGLCTGSLIAPTWVLTAAHCVTDSRNFKIDSIYVMFVSETNDAASGNTKLAASWTANPSYSDQTGLNDIALIELRGEQDGPFMPITEVTIRPKDVGEDFRIVGFGATSDNDNSVNSKKRVVDVPLVDYDNALMHTQDDADDQNACHGDSGGPVLRLYEDGSYSVAGLVSFGGPSCMKDGAYSARVDNYMDFIDEHVEDYELWSAEEEEEPVEEEDTAVDENEGEDEDELVGTDPTPDTPAGICGTEAPVGLLAAGLAVALAGRRRRHS